MSTERPPAVARAARRKYTSKACEECRRRRAKCDGKRPSCSRCTDRQIDCRYRFEEDGRRPAPKSYVQLLRNRIEVLERVLCSHGIDIDAEVARATADDSASQTVQTAGSALAQSHGSRVGTSTSEFEDLCVAFEGALSFDESLNFDQDGELRYFGPTSGRLEFHPCGYNASDSPPGTQINETPNSIPHQIPLNSLPQYAEEAAIVPPDVKEELMRLYFFWNQPWHPAVNEDLFRDSERNGGRFFSPLLLNCILALGSRFTDKPELRLDPDDSNTAGRMFLAKAEALLPHDLKRPSITTLQSLCLIATMYFAIGADAAGWLHNGMAIRLGLDMGMNLDSALLARSDLMSAEEVDLRRQIYWTLYCDDKLAASYTGRVCTMLDAQGLVKMPTNSKPHQNALISLCRILEKILMGLYAPRPALTGPQKAPFLSRCILELKSWFYDLPAEMRIGDRLIDSEKLLPPPQTYTTHMVYHTSFILLMKPFLGKTTPPDQTQHGAEHSNDRAKKAAAICYEASRQMILVARRYRQAYGTFRESPVTVTHCSLSAALILLQIAKLSSSTTNGEEEEEEEATALCKAKRSIRMVEVCLEVLQELSISWDIAKRLRTNLVKLYEQFCDSSEGAIGREGLPSMASSFRNSLDAVEQPPISDYALPLASSHDDQLPYFLEGPSTEVGGYTALGDFTEEMLLDESLWTSAGQDLAFDDPLQSDYMSANAFSRWHFDDM